MEARLVRVHVVAGFLGAGKTTTLSRLLARRAPGDRVAVVVNDAGTGGLDASALSGVELRAIAGGCVCCTAPSGFVQAVRELVEAGVERIFVEPSGVARPADLVDTLRRAPYRDQLELMPLIVLVDPHQLSGPHGEELRRQAEVADVLVVNRVDLATEEELAATRAWIEGCWPGPARVAWTSFGEVGDDVLAPLEGREAPPEVRFRPTSLGWTARTWTWSPSVRLSRASLRRALGARDLTRAKGLFRTDEGWFRIERAGDTVHEEPTGWRRDSRLDAVALEPGVLDTLDEALASSLAAEGTGAVDRVEVAWPDGRVVSWGRPELTALEGNLPDVGVVVPGRSGIAAPLAPLLADAPPGVEVVVVSTDGYTTPPTPVDQLRTGFLVHSVGDGPLPEKLGGPFRLLLPGDVASPCSNVKSVQRVVVRSGA